MRRLRLPLRNPARWLGCALLVARAIALEPTEWRSHQTIDVPAAGLIRVELPEASFDAGATEQQDLRITDPDGREVASLLDRPEPPRLRLRRISNPDIRLDGNATIVTFATGTTEPLHALTLETPAPYFVRATTVEASSDGQTWTPLDTGLPLFRQWGAEKLSLPLGKRSAAHLRVIIADRRATPLPITGVSLLSGEGAAPEAIAVGATIAKREEYAGETVLTVIPGGKNIPLTELTIDTPESVFMRRINVAIRETDGVVSRERIVATGTLYRVALDGAAAKSELTLKFPPVPSAAELLVHVVNGDSPPLAIEQIHLKRQPLSLLFLAARPGTYSLLSGNAQVCAPRYDLATLASDLRSAKATSLAPGTLSPTDNYRPRDKVAAPSLDEVPLTGAPLDISAWSRQRPLLLEKAGVQELELDAAALAHARSDYGDIRVMRGGNQVPYVLELPGLARSVTLALQSELDTKRPSLSRWKIQLPEGRLPLLSLSLTTKTSLFQRQFRIYERTRASDSGSLDRTLATEAWQRTPEPGSPATRVFTLNTRPQGDVLYLETDNGDNPPLDLKEAVVLYPVARLVFKTAETDGFALAYGNGSVAAPRYDLGLVAPQLLNAPRTSLRLDAEEKREPSFLRTAFGSLQGGPLFWGALALVVIVLLVVIARLLPKQP